ncbi:MAG: GGDEF domain-containing protein [Clostridia bacterium]|nr:GGDEF domain-containing protein [Clostridia bacterium]
MDLKDDFDNILQNAKEILNDEQNGKQRTRLITYMLFGGLTLVSGLIALFFENDSLSMMNFLFFFTNCINVLLLLTAGQKGLNIAGWLFVPELSSLLLYFLISGNPDGFSAIWLILFPFGAMIDHGLKKGTILTVSMFSIIGFLLWTPVGKSLLLPEAIQNYSTTFCAQFPLVFLLACGFAFFLQAEKERTHIDPLTALNNRKGFWAELTPIDLKRQNIFIGAFDVDNFKQINDKFGHTVGDEVLRTIGSVLGKKERIHFARWGGDEFVFWFRKCDGYEEMINEWIRKITLRMAEIDEKDLNITMSVGVCITPCQNFKDIKDCMKIADEALYQAKEQGKNQVVYIEKV